MIQKGWGGGDMVQQLANEGQKDSSSFFFPIYTFLKISEQQLTYIALLWFDLPCPSFSSPVWSCPGSPQSEREPY